jgi:hypothetical protein
MITSFSAYFETLQGTAKDPYPEKMKICEDTDPYALKPCDGLVDHPKFWPKMRCVPFFAIAPASHGEILKAMPLSVQCHHVVFFQRKIMALKGCFEKKAYEGRDSTELSPRYDRKFQLQYSLLSPVPTLRASHAIKFRSYLLT